MSRLLGNFELNRSMRLVLHEDGTGKDCSTEGDVVIVERQLMADSGPCPTDFIV
ncbi:MAG: hypothetical protein WBG17_02890 [Burkholderiaceae bacterium]